MEKAAGIAVVLFIILPIVGMWLDKNGPAIGAFLQGVFYLILIIGAGTGAVVAGYRFFGQLDEHKARKAQEKAEAEERHARYLELLELHRQIMNVYASHSTTRLEPERLYLSPPS